MPSANISKSNSRFGTPDFWVAAIRGFRPSGTLKRDRDSLVYHGRFGDHEAVVKLRPLGSPIQRLRFALGLSKHHRQWRGHERLWKAGITTCSALCLARVTAPSESPKSLLALELVPGHTLLNHLHEQDLPPSAENRLARRLGRQIAQVALSGYRNRDCKLSNLIAVDPTSESPLIAVLDAEGIRRRGLMSAQRACGRMLFSVAVEPVGLGIPMRRSLAGAVALACARELLREPAHRPASQSARVLAKTLLKSAAQRLQAHGDPVPRIDPRVAAAGIPPPRAAKTSTSAPRTRV